jgi:hypothetical protein
MLLLLVVKFLGVWPLLLPLPLQHGFPGSPPTGGTYIPYQLPTATSQLHAGRVANAIRSACNNNIFDRTTMTKSSSLGRLDVAIPPTAITRLLW